MKIAHISILSTYSSGIFKKINDKAFISMTNNLNVDFYLLNPVQEYHKDNLFIIKKSYEYLYFNFFKSLAFKILKFKILENLIDLKKYDAIVLRYPLVDGIGNKSFVIKYGKIIFTEHHTDEISELKSSQRFIDRIREFLEINNSSTFLSNINGIIAVTDEIKEIELKKIHKKIPSIVIANGINIDSFKKTQYKKFDNVTLRLVFIASIFSSWHGLERLIELLETYDDKVKIELNLVGELLNNQKILISKFKNINVKFIVHGKLYNGELDNLMENMNLGISSLYLSNKNMKEACTLKSREYIVRNLPFIYAYKDTDLNGNEEFAKRFTEDNISINEIIKFALKVSVNKIEIINNMEDFIPIISWKYKLTRMKDFIINAY